MTDTATTGPTECTRDLTCARCGYDQRGVMTTWHDSCPVEGICPECGFTFEWRELLSPVHVLPRWCIESRRPFHFWPRQFASTAARCWRPGRLWLQINPFHSIHQRRLAIWLATWLFVFIGTVILCNGIMAGASYRELVTMQSRGGIAAAATFSTTPIECILQAIILPLSKQSPGGLIAGGVPVNWGSCPSPRYLLDEQLNRDGIPMISLLLSVPIVCAMTFAALPISRRRAKVRWLHIVRAAVYAEGISFAITCLLIVRVALQHRGFHVPNLAVTSTMAEVLSDVLRTIGAGVSLMVVSSLLAFVPITYWFWHTCAKRYLRMEHAWAIALSVSIIGLLGPISMLGMLWVLLDFRLRL